MFLSHKGTLVQERIRDTQSPSSATKVELASLWRHDKIRFLIVGAFNTAFGYCVFAFLYLLLGNRIHYLVVAVVAHAVSVLVSFTSQRQLVFRSRAPWLPEFIRFNLSLLSVFLGGLAALYGLVDGLGTPPLVGQAIVTVGSVVGSYFAHRHFSFRKT